MYIAMMVGICRWDHNTNTSQQHDLLRPMFHAGMRPKHGPAKEAITPSAMVHSTAMGITLKSNMFNTSNWVTMNDSPV